MSFKDEDHDWPGTWTAEWKTSGYSPSLITLGTKTSLVTLSLTKQNSSVNSTQTKYKFRYVNEILGFSWHTKNILQNYGFFFFFNTREDKVI